MKRFMEITFFITFAFLAVLSMTITHPLVIIGAIVFFLLFLRAADYKPVEQSIADQPIYLTPKGKSAIGTINRTKKAFSILKNMWGEKGEDAYKLVPPITESVQIDGETGNIIPCPDTHAVDISEKVKADMESAGLPYIDPSCYKKLLNTASRAASLWHSPKEAPDREDKFLLVFFNIDDYNIIRSEYFKGSKGQKTCKAWAYVSDLLKLAPIPDEWSKKAEACGNEIIKENIKKSVEEDLKNPKWEKVSIDKAGEES